MKKIAGMMSVMMIQGAMSSMASSKEPNVSCFNRNYRDSSLVISKTQGLRIEDSSIEGAVDLNEPFSNCIGRHGSTIKMRMSLKILCLVAVLIFKVKSLADLLVVS